MLLNSIQADWMVLIKPISIVVFLPELHFGQVLTQHFIAGCLQHQVMTCMFKTHSQISHRDRDLLSLQNAVEWGCCRQVPVAADPYGNCVSRTPAMCAHCVQDEPASIAKALLKRGVGQKPVLCSWISNIWMSLPLIHLMGQPQFPFFVSLQIQEQFILVSNKNSKTITSRNFETERFSQDLVWFLRCLFFSFFKFYFLPF